MKRLPGLLFALLALAANLVLGVVSPHAEMRGTSEQRLEALLANRGAICRSGIGGDQQAPHRHATDCALCSFRAAISTASLQRNDGAALPLSRVRQIAVAINASSGVVTTQPSRLARRPRGPPALA